MENAQTQDTLRDTLEESFDAVSEAPEPRQSAIVAAPSVEDTEAKEQRARDEAGRFAKQAETPQANSVVEPSSEITAPVPAAPAIRRPSTWKKDYWGDFDKIATENPKFAEYLNQRESEYASGVSTYRAEAENAKHLRHAIEPFLPNLQKHGVEPTQWIKALGTAHEKLALGSPQEKVQHFSQLLNQYGVDPQHLFQMLSGQQPNIPPQQPAYDHNMVRQAVREEMTQEQINSEYWHFVTEAPEKYPHFDEVRDTMAGLLQAELAQDYPSAYEAAIRHPRHADIWESMQQQQRESNVTAEREKANTTAKSAKSRAVSTASSTPSGASAKPNGKTGLREQLSEAFDNISSRV